MIHRTYKINKNIMGSTTSISLLVFIFSDLDKEYKLALVSSLLRYLKKGT